MGQLFVALPFHFQVRFEVWELVLHMVKRVYKDSRFQIRGTILQAHGLDRRFSFPELSNSGFRTATGSGPQGVQDLKGQYSFRNPWRAASVALHTKPLNSEREATHSLGHEPAE